MYNYSYSHFFVKKVYNLRLNFHAKYILRSEANVTHPVKKLSAS
jgi:hypothetical protein